MRSLLCAGTMLCSALAIGGVTVETQTEPSLQWMTLQTKTARVQIVYPEGADRAVLSVTGLDGQTVQQSATAPASEIEWMPFGEAEAPEGDDLYTLELQFFNGSNPIGEALVCKIAVLRDSFVGASVRAEGTKAWKNTKYNKVVAPFDANWINGTTPVAVAARQGDVVVDEAESDTRGWFGFCPNRVEGWDVGNYVMTLGQLGEEPTLTAALKYGVPGLALIFK